METITLEIFLVLSAAGVLAGAVNAIAGGGTFFSFPVLVWAGLPPLVANTTNMVALMPAYGAALPPLRNELKSLGRVMIVPVIAGTIGGLVGALLLLYFGDAVFESAVPYLIGFATLLFALAPTMRSWVTRWGSNSGGESQVWTATLIFGFSIYGGYFGAGIGQILLAALILVGFDNLRAANALKNVISFAISVISVLVFALSGTVAWKFAFILMISATIGGYLGGMLSARAPLAAMRTGIIIFGCCLTAYYFYASF